MKIAGPKSVGGLLLHQTRVLGLGFVHMKALHVILNIIWLLTAGIWLWLAYIIAGAIACIFIITIPFGVASFRIANYILWPFGREVVDTGKGGGMSMLGNVIWFLVAGLWLALGHVTTAIAQALTIIGLPLAWANLKLIPVTCFPFGKKIVDSSDAKANMIPLARP
ncbi:Inner membrane protein YccF [Corynebacterium gerontici]|uniref:Inner membrane protein YccF n=2 Tax=Corynebacterium gerontici TaxID=2079234 RepID=A0A3G6J291_9CORY|nr:Inner membrane protein YccF [Corynebacterium gerontici]